MRRPGDCSVRRRGRVDHLAHLGDLGRWKTADLGVLMDNVFVLGKIDAERFVVGDVKVPSLKTRVDAIAGYLGIEIGWKETKIAGVVTRKIKRGRRKRRAIKVSQARKRKK